MKIEPNNIYLGDSYELIKEIPDKSVDLLLTDPPYLIENTNAGEYNSICSSFQKMNNQLENSNGQLTNGIDEKILDEFMRVMKVPNIYIWCNAKQIPMYLRYFVDKHSCKFDIIIWWKTNAVPTFNNKYLTDKEYCLYFRKGGYCNPANYEDAKTVWTQPLNVLDKKDYGHPTIKPLNIIEALIRNSSKPGDLIFDPFMGSGTTAYAAKINDRKYLGFEINPEFHKIAVDRVNGFNQKGEMDLFAID